MADVENHLTRLPQLEQWFIDSSPRASLAWEA